MGRVNHGAPKLPQNLLDQVQPSSDRQKSGNGGRTQIRLGGRKEQRKAARAGKKKQKQVGRPFEPAWHNRNENEKRILKSAPVKVQAHVQSYATKKEKEEPKIPPTEVYIDSPIKAPISRTIRAKLQDDDAEIAALEKRLGLKGKKRVSKSAEDDGLDDLLGDLDEFADEALGKRKRSDYNEYLASKRRHVEGSEDVLSDEAYDSDDQEATDPSGDEEEGIRNEDGEHSDNVFEDFGGSPSLIQGQANDTKGSYEVDEKDEQDDDEEEEDEEEEDNVCDLLVQSTRRENPYIAPIHGSTPAAAKYVPPSMRSAPKSDVELLTRLRRQLQGLVNRLSDANLLTIVRDVDEIYNNHPRQHVTDVLMDLLMSLVCDRSALVDTFIILHAGFAVSIHRKFGQHFGAQVLERCVAEFDKFYELEKASAVSSKETTNVIAYISDLYTLGLVGANLIFDYIRLFLSSLTELHTELLLKIIKTCGSQLRHDDPSALKDIVVLLQKSVANTGESRLPVRTKFMIEMINDLKNNKMKTSLAASPVAAEHTMRMKKTLGTLKPCEPLGVGLSDIKSADKAGKWYLVGASWRNDAQNTALSLSGHNLNEAETGDEDEAGDQTTLTASDHFSADLNALAKAHRMNTSVRRAIFINVMSASDYQDAHKRVTKLRLKKAQELEIPRVLIHCAASERDGYNPYYTLIAKYLCREHRYRWAMQYGLWSIFKRLNEKSGGDAELDEEAGDEEDESLGPREIVNLGRMYGTLMADDALSLTSFKVLDFAYLQAKTKMFVEIILATAFKHFAKKQSSESSDADAAIANLLTRAKDAPQVISGLHFLLTRQVSSPEDIACTSSERKVLKRSFKTARAVLSQLSTTLS